MNFVAGKSKISGIATLVIAIIALCLSTVSFVRTQRAENDEGVDTQYVIFLGTNDKDTNEPVFSKDEAKARLEDILLKHFGGYTILEANGGWADDGTVYQEYTLVICLSDTTMDKVRLAADEMLEVFNQRSVLIQSNQTKTELYYPNT
jgi:hypothetical protein